MHPKPQDFGSYYANAFKNAEVVAAYRYRPSYPPEVFDILARLITTSPRNVLDIGTGSGDIARHLITRVDHIDAVDFSHNMLERGKQLPNGDHPHLHWIYGKVEEVQLTPPYALITAGSSIHWMDWEKAFPLFQSLLVPSGYLALVSRRVIEQPWDKDFRQLRKRYSTRKEPRASVVLEELLQRHLFQVQGQQDTAPIPFNQTIDDFIEGIHSRSSFSRELMGRQAADEFDQQARKILQPYQHDGILPLHVVGTVIWGKPMGQ